MTQPTLPPPTSLPLPRKPGVQNCWRYSSSVAGATCLIFLLIFLSALAQANGPFRLDQTYGGRWHDAEKSANNTRDDWLCWASTAANVLAWTKWGMVDQFTDEDQIFDYFARHWTDDPSGSPREAWRWWFSGKNLAAGGARVVAEGGNFFPDVPFPAEKWECKKNALFCGIGQNMLKNDPLILKKLLERGYGVALQIVRPDTHGGRESHMITLWGFDADNKNPFRGMFVTDSDDSKEFADSRTAENILAYYPLELIDNIWWFTYREQKWRILAAYGLLARHLYRQ